MNTKRRPIQLDLDYYTKLQDLAGKYQSVTGTVRELIDQEIVRRAENG